MGLTDIIVLVFTGIVILSTIFWLFFICHWILRKIGLWKKIKFMRLKRRFNGLYNPSDDIITFADDLIRKGFDYYSVKKFVRHNFNKDEILYTYLLLKKANKREVRL